MPQAGSRQGCALLARRFELRRPVVAIAVAFLLSGAAAARLAGQSAPAGPAKNGVRAPDSASLPDARTVLDRHLEAIGGRHAVLSHRSTLARGQLQLPKAGVTGTVEIYTAAPNKSLLKVTLNGVGEVVEGFDGAYGWSQSPMTGPMLLDGKQLEEKKFDSDFHSELRAEGRYVSMTTLEKTEFEGRPCYQVRLVRTTGAADIEFYDVATGLRAGSIASRETVMGKVTGTTVESDYRKFGNLLVPTTIKSRMGGVEQVITITDVEYDNVPASVFEMPAAIRALVK